MKIVLSDHTILFQYFVEWIENETTRLASTTTKVRMFVPFDEEYVTWVDGLMGQCLFVH
jgi:hypothetical protein